MIRPSKLVARGLKSSAFNMRAISGSPDYVFVHVEGQRGDGLWQVRRDHWPVTINVPAVPHNADIPFPSRCIMLFEDGDRQRPFIYWPYRTKGTGTIEPFFDWPTLRRNSARTNDLPTVFLDEAAAMSYPSPLPTPVYDLRQWQGDLAWHDGGGGLFVNGVKIFDAYSDLANFNNWNVGGLTFQDGILYCLHSDCAVAAVQMDGTFLWSRVVFSDWGLPGGFFDGGWLEPHSSPTILNGRVIVLGERYDFANSTHSLISINAATGGDVNSLWWGSVTGYDERLECWVTDPKSPNLWVTPNGNCYFTDYSGRAVCLKVAPETGLISFVWSSGLGLVNERRRAILGIVGTNLILAYEDHFKEEVQDEPLDLGRWDEHPVSVPPRVTYQPPATAPIGIVAGIESLSLADGTFIAEHPQPGSTPWRTWHGENHDYITYGDGHVMTAAEKYLLDPTDPAYYDPGFGSGFPDFIPYEYPHPDYNANRSPNGNSFLPSSIRDSDAGISEHDNYFDKGYDPSEDPLFAVFSAPILSRTFQAPGPPTPDILNHFWFSTPGSPVSSSASGHADQTASRLQNYVEGWGDEFMALTGVLHRVDGTHDFLRNTIDRHNMMFLIVTAIDGGIDVIDAEPLTYQDPPLSHLHLEGAPLLNTWFVETAGTSRFDSGEGNPALTSGFMETQYGENYVRSRRYLWRHDPTYEVLRTPTMLINVGRACNQGEQLVLAGFNNEKLEWRSLGANGSEQWRYTITGQNLELSGAPFATDGKVHTEITRNGVPSLVTLDAAGNLLSEVECPNMKSPTFDGVGYWVSEDGQNRFGPATIL